MQEKSIYIKGAKEHNLKNVDLKIPRDKFVVFTGISGSGKSSLAFDTLYAEGQRRYVESLSSYARMFLGQMEKPDVEYIEGLSPAISIDQKTTAKNPRSTVGTVTEIYDYLRLLYARVGIPHCPKCGKEIKKQTVDQIVDKIKELPPKTKFQVLAPVIRRKKGEHVKLFEDAKKNGFVRVRVDGIVYDLSEEIKLEKNIKHNIEIVVDRLVMKEDIDQRLTDSVETAASLASGIVIIDIIDGEEMTFSQNYACDDCGISMEELSPRMFSFNNPLGACPCCSGIGSLMKVDPELILDYDKSLNEGGILASGWGTADNEDSVSHMYFDALGKKYGFDFDTKIKDFSQQAIDALLYGTKGERLELFLKRSYGTSHFFSAFEGIITNLERRYRDTHSELMKAEIEKMMSFKLCPECGGKRLRPDVLAVTVGGKNIYEVTNMPVEKAKEFFLELKLSDRDLSIGGQVLKEINERINFLCNVGL